MFGNSAAKKYHKALKNMEQNILKACKKYGDSAVYIKKSVGPDPYVTMAELGGFTMTTAKAAIIRANGYLEKAITDGREAIYLADGSQAKGIVLSKAELTIENFMVGRGDTFYYEVVDKAFRQSVDVLVEQLENAIDSI